MPQDSDEAELDGQRAAGVSDLGGGTGSASMSASELTLGFGRLTVLSDVSIDFRPGQITALLGPTGSG